MHLANHPAEIVGLLLMTLAVVAFVFLHVGSLHDGKRFRYNRRTGLYDEICTLVNRVERDHAPIGSGAIGMLHHPYKANPGEEVMASARAPDKWSRQATYGGKLAENTTQARASEERRVADRRAGQWTRDEDGDYVEPANTSQMFVARQVAITSAFNDALKSQGFKVVPMEGDLIRRTDEEQTTGGLSDEDCAYSGGFTYVHNRPGRLEI